MSLPVKTRFDPGFPIVGTDGRASQQFRDYMRALDALVGVIATGMNLALVNAANDGAAAAAGVGVGQLYRNGSVIMVRVV